MTQLLSQSFATLLRHTMLGIILLFLANFLLFAICRATTHPNKQTGRYEIVFDKLCSAELCYIVIGGVSPTQILLSIRMLSFPFFTKLFILKLQFLHVALVRALHAPSTDYAHAYVYACMYRVPTVQKVKKHNDS